MCDGQDCVQPPRTAAGGTPVLSAHDDRAGLRVVQQLAAAATAPDTFARRGVILLSGVVASELTTLSVCDLASGHRHVIGTPPDAIGAAERAAFDRHFNEHPLVRHHAYAGGRDAHRISDSVPFARFREGALYAEYYRRVGIDHALAVPLQMDGRLLVSFVLNRSRRDFSDRERERLNALTPALGELYRHTVALARVLAAARCLRDLLDGEAAGVIRVGARGEVRDFSPRAAAVVRRLWQATLRRGGTLPAPLAESTRAALARPSLASTLPPLAIASSGGRLTVRAYPAPDGAGLYLLLEQATPALALERWPLAPREREVLHWVAAGKTDREVAQILGISARTVHKHLQRSYEKLGVETRTAAVMRVLATGADLK